MLFVLVLIASIVFASFAGHWIHWVLHQPWAGPAHVGHLQHHLTHYPPGKLTSDTYFSAKWYHSGPFLFTPPLVFLLAVLGGMLWLLHAPAWILLVFGISLVGFGLVNDYAHDAFHVRRHWLMRFKWYKKARKRHFVHHNNMRVNLGILSYAWDRVFGTMSDER